MKKIFLFSFLFAIMSCKKEEVGQTISYIKNSTSHTIKLLPYNTSVLDNSNVKVISANSTLEVYSANVRGKTIDPCFGTLLQPYDSVLVVYDDTYKIPHIKFNLTYVGSKKVLFNSNRSISNASNWTKTITNETKYSIEGNFNYTFIEQDYIDAQ